MKVLLSLTLVAALTALSTPINAKNKTSLGSETSDLSPEQTLGSDPSTELSEETNTSSVEDLDDKTSENDLTESTTDTSSSLFDDLTETTDSTTDLLENNSTDSTDLLENNSTDSTDLLENNSTELTEDTDTLDSASSLDASTEQSASDVGFSDELKAIWIERHNFFRVAALPWAAGNMRRIGWDDDLAEKAASAVSSCAANTSTGINVYESTSTEPSTVLEEAINEWVIEPVLSEIGRVVPPAAEGDTVGAGMYNSYSQVVWASTTSVGCAMSKCSKGSMVACEYSPAGNDGKSEWYIHAAQATQCPKKTSSNAGLCVKEGDPANDPIAPVPEDQTSLKVYPKFISDLMSAILKAAQARDTPGAKSLRKDSSKKSSPSELSPGAETDEASNTDTDETDEDLETEISPSSTLTEDDSSSLDEDTDSKNKKPAGKSKSNSKISDDYGTEEASSPTTEEESETTKDSSNLSTDNFTDPAETSTADQNEKASGKTVSFDDDLDALESSSSKKKSSGKKKLSSLGDDDSTLDADTTD